MSIDLEDYFCDLPFSKWERYEDKIVETTSILLDLFSKHNVKSTFFVVGYIAEKFPNLINEIQEKGHEIASHSYSHLDLRKATKNEVQKDLLKSFETIENVTGERVLGFRAPFFSIDHRLPEFLDHFDYIYSLKRKIPESTLDLPARFLLFFGGPHAEQSAFLRMRPKSKGYLPDSSAYLCFLKIQIIFFLLSRLNFFEIPVPKTRLFPISLIRS